MGKGELVRRRGAGGRLGPRARPRRAPAGRGRRKHPRPGLAGAGRLLDTCPFGQVRRRSLARRARPGLAAGEPRRSSRAGRGAGDADAADPGRTTRASPAGPRAGTRERTCARQRSGESAGVAVREPAGVAAGEPAGVTVREPAGVTVREPAARFRSQSDDIAASEPSGRHYAGARSHVRCGTEPRTRPRADLVRATSPGRARAARGACWAPAAAGVGRAAVPRCASQATRSERAPQPAAVGACGCARGSVEWTVRATAGARCSGATTRARCSGATTRARCPGATTRARCPGATTSARCPGATTSARCPGATAGARCPGATAGARCPGAATPAFCPSFECRRWFGPRVAAAVRRRYGACGASRARGRTRTIAGPRWRARGFPDSGHGWAAARRPWCRSGGQARPADAAREGRPPARVVACA